MKKVLIPKDSFQKISKIPQIEIYCASSLKEAIEFFKSPLEKKPLLSRDFEYEYIKADGERYYFLDEYPLNFIEVKGQERAKRASLIAAAGMHNILFNGSPGCGKSMCAKRIRYIMPPMSKEEILEKAKLDALSERECDFRPLRAFRSPHHSSSKASIFGGGSKSAKIGEIALANNGVLFFDELPYFQKGVLESLREPLEDHRLLISRVNSKVLYETKFLFIGAMNPCPCGNLLSKTKSCRCSDLEIKRYKNRLSSPLLDRIDIYVEMEEISEEDSESIDSKEMFESVKRAFLMQKRRGQEEFNGKLSDKDLERFCKIGDKEREVLNMGIKRFSLSQRGINKVLRVARTIADLKAKESIGKEDILEALSYRMR
ncbi:MAG: ATP-binding protein [Epsilonproteobacteria bacterium]|nr:ATP-binding protein [Campylobacterota bacterium]